MKVTINYDSSFEKDFDVNLAIYAEYACDISFATTQQAIALAGNSNIKWVPPKSDDSGPWNNMGNTAYNSGSSGWGNGGKWKESLF